MREINMPLAIDEIVINERREVDPATVKRLADSIDKIGLRHPITVRKHRDQYILVAGRHRIEACKKLGREHVQATIVTMTNAEARMWEIAENLHRAELTKLQRAEQIDEWRELAAKGAQLAHPNAQPHERGVSKVAEELGVSREEVQRSEKIAHITPEAKAAAHEAGIDDNQSKLLAVSKEAPEKQVAKVIELASKHGESKDDWLAYMERGWARGHADWREEFLAKHDFIIMDRQHG